MTDIIVTHERVGTAYRGLIVCPLTFRTLLTTAHTYASKEVAETAMRRLWSERKAQETAA